MKNKKVGDLNAIKNMIVNTRKPMNRFGEIFFMKLTHSSDESSQWCFNIIENKKLPCFNQVFKEQIEEIYQTTEDNIKKMINCMKTTMNEQKQFFFVSKDAKFKVDEVKSYIDYLYLPAMENFHEWLKIFLDKAIQCRRATSILREHEQSYKIKKDKYELLCEEVIKNIELLEAKGKADIPNYPQSMYDSMNIFYHQTINYFPESDSRFNKNNLKKNNDNTTNNGNIILIFPLKVYPLESYGRELQHMLKSTILDN
ncbi:hypothetical protein H8356DRAFT_1359073 [Neocallimastix lanati (nom. inval.)]|nr:hypothetical protein H8356DRAFT_1359073 [Neocallimastix sp. JGI-2020a]